MEKISYIQKLKWPGRLEGLAVVSISLIIALSVPILWLFIIL